MTASMLGMAGRLGSSTDALAALGALIRIESEHVPVDPDVHAVLQAIGAELLGAPAEVTPESAPVLGLAQTFFAQGAELLRKPGPHRRVGPGGRRSVAARRANVRERRGGDSGRRPGCSRVWPSN